MRILPQSTRIRYNNRTNLVCFLGRFSSIKPEVSSMARSRRRVQPRFWLILIALMLSAFALVWSSQQDLIEQREAMIEELTAAREELEIRIAESQRQLQFSKSDEYIERLARSELGLVMPDEVLYVSPQND